MDGGRLSVDGARFDAQCQGDIIATMPMVNFVVFAVQSNQVQLNKPLLLADGISASQTSPIKYSGVWPKWLGSLRTEDFESSNLYVLVQDSNEASGVQDGAFNSIIKKLLTYIRALEICGLIRVNHALWVAGWKDGRKANIVRTANYEKPASNKDRDYPNINEAFLKRATQVFEGLVQCYAEPAKNEMILLGLYALQKGLREGTDLPLERPYEFVRSIEALLTLDASAGNKKFGKRASFFTGRSSLHEETLRDMYVLRNCASHFLDWRVHERFASLSASTKTRRVNLRILQAELLALALYERILTNAPLRKHLGTRDELAKWWQKAECQREALFGKPIALRSLRAKHSWNSRLPRKRR